MFVKDISISHSLPFSLFFLHLSQPFSQSYRSILPTSLIYVLLFKHQRLLTLRTCCGYRYETAWNYHSFTLFFMEQCIHTHMYVYCAPVKLTHSNWLYKKAFILLLLYAVGSDYLFPYHYHNYFPPFLQACKHIASLNKSNSAVFIYLSSTYTNAHEQQYCCCF